VAGLPAPQHAAQQRKPEHRQRHREESGGEVGVGGKAGEEAAED